MIVLDSKAYSKKEGEQCERFQINAGHQYPLERAIEPSPVKPRWQELLEN
jgi:hypothetical protein